jgi:murein DD-endopeptidase MepM/ murein hydrolase activator NlpD
VLTRHGLLGTEALQAIAGLSKLDARNVRAGTEVVAEIHPDSGVTSVAFNLGIDRVVRLLRTANGWEEREEVLPWTVDTVVVAGVVTSNLISTVVDAAEAFPREARAKVAHEIAGVLEYRFDMSRDLRVGDSIYALLERESTARGHVRAGRVLATRASIAGTRVDAVRFAARDGEEAFFDGDGRSLKAAYLRTPLEFSRISSVFGGRRHPILKTWRRHTGIDYAASAGTPVRAIGDGRVVFAGWKGGYGRTVEIRHANGMITRYAHLSAISAGVKSGAHVRISSTIGKVGSTGMATGPHLHFETIIGGVHKDPKLALKNAGGGEVLPAAQLAAFRLRKGALLGDLDARVLAMQAGQPLPASPRAAGVQPAEARAAGAAN